MSGLKQSLDQSDNAQSGKNVIESILDLDIHLQRQLYAGWPASWAQMKWPVGSIRALLLIESGHAHTPREVADVLNVSRTNVTGILDRLETDSLITRTIDPNDRRSFMLELTDAGRELVRQIDSLRRNQLEQALAILDTASLEALHTGLAALTHSLEVCQKKSKVVPEESLTEEIDK